MKNLFSKKNLYAVLYIAVIFSAIYGCKYLVDAAAYSITNLDTLISGIAETVGRILSIFTIVVMGSVIAYILDPSVTFLQKKLKIKRVYSVLLLYLLLFLLIAAAVFAIYKKISVYDPNDTANAFSIAYLHYKDQFTELYDKFCDFFKKYDFFDLTSDIKHFFRPDLLKAAQNVGKWAGNIFLSLIIAFYFLKDKKHLLLCMKRFFRLILPPKAFYVLKSCLYEVHSVFSGYIRGQLTDALIISILTASILSILKIPFAAAIGIISGFTNIIPFFGAITGFVLSTLTALLSRGVMKAVITAIAVIVIQQIDSILIVPRVVGENVSLSPVMVIISLGIAGNIFGLTGMIFAVPVTALGKIFLEKGLKRLERIKLRQNEEIRQ